MKRAVLILICLLPLSFLFGAGQPETPAAETADSAEVDKSSPLSLYNAGDYKESADLFLQNPGRGQKRTANYYNAARAWHQDYLDNENIESLEKAVEGYYRVLDYDPAHSEALVNLELARRELEKNMEQSSQRQDSESQDSGQDAGQGDQSEKDAGQGDQSEKDAGQGDQGGGQDQSQSDRLNDLADKQEQLADAPRDDSTMDQQSDLSRETMRAADESGETPSEALQQAMEKQQEAMDQMAQGNEDEARQAQSEAASLLRQAASESSAEGSDQGAEEEGLPQDLQSLLNREQARNREDIDPQQVINVERNW